MYTVLIVDDDSKSIKELGDILNPYYKIRAANSAENAFKVLEKFNDIELILLDVIMPFITGYEMLEELKKDDRYKHIPVVLVSGLDDIADEYRGLGLGAIDYIQKPFLASVLLARINIHLNTSIERKKLLDKVSILESGTDGVKKLPCYKFNEIVFVAISYLTNTINISLGMNSKSQKYFKLIADNLLKNKIYHFELNEKLINDMCLAVPLHDIGLLGIHDNILLKKEKYTSDEFNSIKNHTILGYESLEYAIKKLNFKEENIEYMKNAIEMTHYHHECWDGSGYPEGLKEFEIPLSARIMSVVDVFDALTSERSYRKKFNVNTAQQMIMNGSGSQFDPKIIKAFDECKSEIKKIAMEEN